MPEEVIVKAKNFARQVASTTNYTDSNQHNIQKITDDHFVSKLGEEAVRAVLIKWSTVIGPDYQIYAGNKKSWEADLFVNGTDLAVKTMRRSAAMRYGLSWTFQSGQARRDHILDKPGAWVIFVEYLDGDAGNCCIVYPPFQISELTFGEPQLAHLKGSKKVVYEHTLPVL